MLHRRLFLRGAGSTAALVLLGACNRGSGAARPNAAATASEAGGAVEDAVAAVAPNAEESLSVVSATFEQLTGKNQPFAFGLRDINNEAIERDDIELFVVPSSGEPGGPYRTEFHKVEGVPLGLYVSSVDLEEAGPSWFVAATADGTQAGTAAVPVAEPADSQAPAPGSDAVSVPTPTVKNPRGVEQVCTRQPPCGMHQVSLDEALRQGRPVMLTFATPAYCQTAVCGPTVDTIEAVRTSGDFADTAWIHVEIYQDAGQKLAKPVEAWGLPSEPWLFVIDRDGKIAGRADGPLLVLPEQIKRLAAGAV